MSTVSELIKTVGKTNLLAVAMGYGETNKVRHRIGYNPDVDQPEETMWGAGGSSPI